MDLQDVNTRNPVVPEWRALRETARDREATTVPSFGACSWAGPGLSGNSFGRVGSPSARQVLEADGAERRSALVST